MSSRRVRHNVSLCVFVWGGGGAWGGSQGLGVVTRSVGNLVSVIFNHSLQCIEEIEEEEEEG